MSTNLNQPLAGLRPGESATVVAISADCPDGERRRLMELGFFPGTEVEATLESPLGDPVAYRVRQMTIALRRRQAQFIQVRRG